MGPITDGMANDQEPSAERSAASNTAASNARPENAKPEKTTATVALRDSEVLREDAPAADWNLSPSSVPHNDPLLSCLAIVSGLLDQPTSTEALRAGLPVGDEPFGPDLCVRAAERAGLSARIVRRPRLQRFSKMLLPCILLLKDRGACVLIDLASTCEAQIVVPESGGKKVTSIAELESNYTGYAIFLQAQARFDERTADIKLMSTKRWFWGTLFRFLPIYRHVFLASFVVNMFAIATPLFTMNVYDRVVPNAAFDTLWVLALGVCIVFGFDFLLRNLRSYFVDVAGKNADVIIASMLLQQVMGMRMDQRPPSTGSLANNLREFESLRDFFSSSTLLAIIDIPFIAIFIAIIYLIGGPIYIVPAFAAPIVIVVGIILQYPLSRIVEQTYRESAQKHSLLVEAINGLEAIKVAGAEGQIQRNWEKLVSATAKSSGQARMISTLSMTFAQVATQATTVAVVIYGVYLISAGEMTIGALIASTILTGRAMAPLGAVAAMLVRYQQSRMALKGLDVLRKTPVERPPSKEFVHQPVISGEIELQNVVFQYPNAPTNALEQVSFRVQNGEKVGIIGRIGSGKSTIGRLIMGLYDPADGAVLIGGSDLRQLDPADLRRNVGYVSQDNYMFFGSVRDNIIFGAPYADDMAIMRSADISGVAQFLRTNPLGYDLPVGERGMSLSGGQRQAVAVARSLLLDPPILVLDEPTSSMDNSTEAEFRRKLTPAIADKTLILITHRSSMLSLVDRLIIVDGGRVVADGPKSQVLEALKRGQVRGSTT